MQETVKPDLDFADRFAPPLVVSSNTKMTGCEAYVTGREIAFVPPKQDEVPENWSADACPIEGMLITLLAEARTAILELTAPDRGELRTNCGVMI